MQVWAKEHQLQRVADPELRAEKVPHRPQQDLRKGTKYIWFHLLAESKRSKWHGEQQTREHEERWGAWRGEKVSPCHHWGLVPTAGVMRCLLMSNISWLDVSPYFPYHYLITRPCCFSAIKSICQQGCSIVPPAETARNPHCVQCGAFSWSVRTVRSSDDPAALCNQAATPSETEWAQEITCLEEIRIQ